MTVDYNAIRASMRPRVFPAEDVKPSGSPIGQSPQASMRPRVFPAEDSAPLPEAKEITLALQ